MFSTAARWLCAPQFASAPYVNVFRRESESRLSLPEDRPKHVFMYARRTFVLNDDFEKAVLRLTADDYYKLYVNGAFAAQGPAPGYPQAYYVNDIDISRYLRTGENVIALIVYYQGLVNRVWVSGDMRQGLICELLLDGRTALASDESFRITVAQSRVPGKVIGYDTQFGEIFIAAKEPWGWREPGFDDSAWQAPCVKTDHGYCFVPQPTSVLDVSDLAPVLIKDFGTSRVYDTGREIAGVWRFTAGGSAGKEIAVRLGEELDEGGHVRFETRANCLYEDRVISDGQTREYEAYDYKGFRYIEVIPEPGAQAEGLYVRVQRYPADESLCQMKCENKALSDVFDLCRHTLLYAVQESFLDCPTREKGQYSGDLAVTSLGHLYVSGDARILKKALCDWMRSGFIAPALMAVFPSALMQEIADYSLLFPMIALRYWQHTGDRAFLAECEKAASDILEVYRRYGRSDGLLTDVTEAWNLVDWPKNLRDGYDFAPDNPIQAGAHNVINALYIGAVKHHEEMCRILNIQTEPRFERLKDAFVSAFLNRGTGLFTDTPSSKHSAVHSNIFPLLFGIAEKEDARRIARWLIGRGMCCGVYMAFFLLKALAGAGYHEAVYDLIVSDGEHSGMNMLSEGATTLFEAWGKEQKWNTSLCHPWACAPLPVLVEDLCGISPALLSGDEWTPRLPLKAGDISLTVPLMGRKVTFIRKSTACTLLLDEEVWKTARTGGQT